MLREYIKEELIFLHLNVLNRNDLFKKLSDIFYEKDYVTEEFYDFIVARETNYPTGLDLSEYTVAIPHGNPEYIKQPFIAIASLEKPIKMNRMDAPETEIEVDLFFILGLDDGEGHLNLLKEVIGQIQQADFVNSLKAAQTSKKIMEIVATVTN